MRKLSPFVEGMLSVLMIAPTATHATPKYIKAQKLDIKDDIYLSSDSAWLEVGFNMRSVAHQQIKRLPKKDKQQLESFLNG